MGLVWEGTNLQRAIGGGSFFFKWEDGLQGGSKNQKTRREKNQALIPGELYRDRGKVSM